MEVMRAKSPAQLVSGYMDVSIGKVNYSLRRLLVLGVMAGAFIALGGASANAACHAIADAGVAKAMSGIVFPVGLIMIVFIGGELFTGDAMMLMGAMHKRYPYLKMVRTLALVWLSNLCGAVLIAFLVVNSGQLDYSGGMLGAFTIKVALGKATLPFGRAFFSGILCNILVCIAVLMASAAKDAAGKILGIIFPIFAFVIGGYEHCVANMYYIPAGIMALGNEAYAAKAMELYGYTAEQLGGLNLTSFFVTNLLPVTLGNIVGGMFFVSLPLYLLHRKEAK